MLDAQDWLRLALAPEDGSVLWGAAARGELPHDELERLVARARERVPEARVWTVEADCRRLDVRVITPADDHWPPLLRELPDPPAALYVRGRTELLARPQIAMVGARRASRRALQDTRWLAEALCRAGIAVTSGLAHGVDGAAHRAVLDAGGETIAVLGCGVDRTYPAAHRDLAAAVAAQGALASEFPPGTSPRPYHFPRRNRVISGLSLGVLVVAAAERSGSLITARLAGAQGREVFAVPGPLRAADAAGCHRLLREGAVLVRDVEDVLAELPVELRRLLRADGSPEAPAAAGPGPGPPSDPVVARILEAVDDAGTPLDLIVARTGLDAAELGARLIELELDGLIGREREHFVRLR